jgi:hypothetical protein
LPRCDTADLLGGEALGVIARTLRQDVAPAQ